MAKPSTQTGNLLKDIASVSFGGNSTSFVATNRHGIQGEIGLSPGALMELEIHEEMFAIDAGHHLENFTGLVVK